MNNYRVEYGRAIEIDYWNKTKKGLQAEASINFRDVPAKFYPELSKIYAEATRLGIKYIWHFYEPYVEMTWLSDDEKASEDLIVFIWDLVGYYGDLKVIRPKDGVFADWYCTSEREREFGAKRHALCAEWVKLYNEYKDCVDAGKGMEFQFARTIHTLANPLGLNYTDEAYLCWRRCVSSVLFKYLSYNKALFVFHKILRFKKK